MNLTINKTDILTFRNYEEFACLAMNVSEKLLGNSPRTYPHDDGTEETRFSRRERYTQYRKAGYLRVLTELRPKVGDKNLYTVDALTPKARAVLAKEDKKIGQPLNPHSVRLTNNYHHDFDANFIAASLKIGANDYGIGFKSTMLDDPLCPEDTRNSASPYSIPLEYWYRDTHVTKTPKGKPLTKRHDYNPIVLTRVTDEGRERKIRIMIERDCDSEDGESATDEHASMERLLRMSIALLDDGFYERHFGTGKFYVVVSVPTVARKELGKRILSKITNGKGHARIVWDVLPDWRDTKEFPPATGWALERDYERVGHPPFNILEALGAKEKRAAA